MEKLISHFRDVEWDEERWPNFHPSEKHLHCPCCGEFYLDEESMDMLQNARTRLNSPIKINSGHRCVKHNSDPNVGGADNSQHLKIAFDISTNGHDRQELLDALRAAGFTTFGFYNSFIHTDKRPYRRWVNKGAEDIWKGII